MRLRTLIPLIGVLILALGAELALAAPAALQPGQRTAGHLAAGTTQIHTVAAGPGQEVRLTVQSSDFTPRVTLRSGGAASSAHGSNAQVRLSTPQGGTFQCQIESANAGQGGSYSILAEVRGGASQASTQRGSSQSAQIAPGQTVSGTLGRGDDTMVSGEYRDHYVMSGVAGQRVTITLTSSDFDSYLILRPPSGGPGTDDDDSGGGRNAQITTTLRESGAHTICVTTVEREETGAYRLSVH